MQELATLEYNSTVKCKGTVQRTEGESFSPLGCESLDLRAGFERLGFDLTSSQIRQVDAKIGVAITGLCARHKIPSFDDLNSQASQVRRSGR